MQIIKDKDSPRFPVHFYQVITLVYCECLFGFSVYGKAFVTSIPTAALFGVFMGLVLGTALSFFGGKLSYVINSIVSAVSAVPFLVEFFINMQFKTVYDVNTVLNGGGDALSGFKDTIASLVFTFSGIAHIVLFFLPAVVILIIGKVRDFRQLPLSVRAQLAAIGMALLAISSNLAIIRSTPVLWNIFDSEYSFQNAVMRFGLYDGIMLDLMIGQGSKDVVFAQVEMPAEMIIPTPTPEPTPTPVPAAEPGETTEPSPTPTPTPVPEPQVMDIDLDQFAEEHSGTMANLATYCSSLEPSMTNEYTGLFEGKNLIMITAEAFTAEVIDPDLTPTLYRLATNGINFNDFYVPATAGTTGGEFSHIFGLLPTSGGSSLPHMTSHGNTYFTMSERLNAQGYYGMAFHNNDYTYYSRNVTHNQLGYSEGYIGWGNGLESYVDPVWPESDLQMFEATVDMYIDHQPFNAYYMTVSGHSNYSRAANAQSRAHWDETEYMEGVYSDTVRAYLTANLELEYSLEYLMGRLEEEGILDDTVICIVADHYPYGLDRNANPGHMPYLSELYGYEVTNYIERDHNRAIIWCGCLEGSDPIIVDSPSSSIDILPTLLNLFGEEWDSRLLPGRDVLSDAPAIYFNANYDWRTDLGTYISSRNEFIPASEDTDIPEGYVDYIRAIVSNKMTFIRGVMSVDFYAELFPVEDT